jgi:hypothetical protein
MLIGTALVWQKLGVVTIPMWKGRGRSRAGARAADSSI